MVEHAELITDRGYSRDIILQKNSVNKSSLNKDFKKKLNKTGSTTIIQLLAMEVMGSTWNTTYLVISWCILSRRQCLKILKNTQNTFLIDIFERRMALQSGLNACNQI